MTILGIVAEYNPFHNGHRYLIEQARKIYPGAAVVCVMSGHFLQRGEPALLNKWARAEMAVHSGADIIIELPFTSAVRSAYFFAKGSVTLLARTGVVTHLLFGSELGQTETLQAIAAILNREPDTFRAQLKTYLGQGYSYPVARSLALQDYLADTDSDLAEILSQPNNILALEYLRVIDELQIDMGPLTIKRQGSFHSPSLQYFASATAIRQALRDGTFVQELQSAMPPDSSRILQLEIENGRAPVFDKELEQLIMYRLRSISRQELADIYEITEGLEHRIKEAAVRSTGLESLRQAIKTKRYSMTRINRALIYTLLGITKKQVADFDRTGPMYQHILAFSERGQEILQEMKKKSTVPILSRGREVKEAADGKMGQHVQDMISIDVLATDLYSLLLPDTAARTGGYDFINSPRRLLL